jgi:GT2 family glycosyltransferase
MVKRTDTGVVVIGRNEGDRLVCSLNSVIEIVHHVVYVDSGSTDDSRSMAEGLEVEVVELDMSMPFTAARARNAGFEHLCHSIPEIIYVQFVDGDCEVVDSWINSAVSTLESRLDVGVVCGRLRERYPEYSIYNQLCDMEWDTSVGEVQACGGIFMIRASLFKDLNGFNASLIAGEEPELCVRIRQKGWKIWRLKDDMALHDANITRFAQWWKRNVRGGHSYAEGAYMHGREPERHCVAESARIWLWGFIIPVGVFIIALFKPLFLMLFLIYPMQIIRIAMRMGATQRSNWNYAFFVMLGKFPEMQGQLQFVFNKFIKSSSRIIEYK